MARKHKPKPKVKYVSKPPTQTIAPPSIVGRPKTEQQERFEKNFKEATDRFLGLSPAEHRSLFMAITQALTGMTAGQNKESDK